MQHWNVVIILDPPDIKSYLEIVLFSYVQDTAEYLSKNLQLLHFKQIITLLKSGNAVGLDEIFFLFMFLL